MATRSIISIKIDNKEFRSIYSHWDGYLDGVGATLFNHYTTFEKVNDLINLGNLSSLGEHLTAPDNVEHTFEKPVENVTVFYDRDRGEKGNNYKVHYSKKAIRCEEYCYLFADNVWYYRTDKANGFRVLTPELIK